MSKFIKTAYDIYVCIKSIKFIYIESFAFKNLNIGDFYQIYLYLDIGKMPFGCTKTKELAEEIIEDIINNRNIVGEYLTETEAITITPKKEKQDGM